MEIKTIIEFNDLSKSYFRKDRAKNNKFNLKYFLNPPKQEIKALKNITFKIKQGEKVALLGPNGAGKTTLVKLIGGIISPNHGHVKVFGLDPVNDRYQTTMNYGIIFGNRSMLWKHIPIYESFLLAKDMYQISNDDFEKRLEYFDQLLNIKEYYHVPPRKLSFGQRIRCEIVFNLLHFPKLILLDEATIGLDIFARKAIIDLLNNITKEHNITLIISSHLINDIEDLSDRLILLDKGNIIFDDLIGNLNLETREGRKLIVSFLETNIKIPANYHKNLSIEKLENGSVIKIILDKTEINNILKTISSFGTILDIKSETPSLEDSLREFYKVE